MGSKKAVKVGYRYLFGIHMGIGKAIDELVAIEVGGKHAWTGSVTSNQRISINAPELFGGDDGEGGISGSLDVMMGAADQPVNASLAAMLGGLVPAFRGVCTLFYDGLVTSMNPYPKAWKMRVRRALTGWDGATWYPERCVIEMASGAIKAMNPAHIIYECLTNRDWGGAMDRSRLNDASFRAAADVLHAEGFGLCLRWVRQDSLSTFVSHVLDHIGGNLFVSRQTGEFELTLVRDDYDPESLPLFDEDSGLLSITEDDNSATAGAANEVIIKWRNPIDNSSKQKRERSLAAIQAAGQQLSVTIEYPGIPTAELAGRVAVRDLRARSIGLKRFKVQLDRRGRNIKPGAPFRIRSLSRGIEVMVVRAGRFEDGTLADGKITITAVQDVFGLPATSMTPPQPGGWVPPDTAPAPVAIRRLTEVTWRDLVQTIDAANLNLVDQTTAFIAALAIKPTSLSLGFAVESRVGSAAYVRVGPGDFCPTGLLVAGISSTATSIQLSGPDNLDLVEVGSAALIDNEVVRVDAIDLETLIVTIARGCVDTVPAAHGAGARVWFFEDYVGEDPTEYSSGVSVQVRLRTVTSSGTLAPELAGTDTLALVGRQALPYPPGNFRLGGIVNPASIEGDVVASWAHRDRLLQADQLIDTQAGNIGPEAGTTYTFRLLRADTQAVLASQTAISGTTATLTTTYVGQVIAELWSVRGGLNSLQRQRWQFDHTLTPVQEYDGIIYSQASVYSGVSAASDSNMRDANTNPATNAATGTGTNNTGSQWIQLDLGVSKPVLMVEVGGGNISGWGSVASYLNGALLQYSDDGSTWSNALSISGVSDSSPLDRQFWIPSTTARYWRLQRNGYLATATFRIYGPL
ncbi:discoidin domain-containing protein [Pseudomonas aeruginosa]|uniref:discoidin domain-containing protein n=1 Tax=Pseudomonas aeruginosa TaxID=287 RepID=UPI002F3F8799